MPARSEDEPGARHWHIGVMVALSALAVAAVWTTPYLPTNDGPAHVLAGVIANHYDDQGSLYPSMFTRLPAFAYQGFFVLFRPLERLFGWRDALRGSIAMIVLGFAWGFSAVTTALAARRRPVGYLGFALAFSWHLYMGFFAYLAGVAVGLWILAALLRRDRLTVGQRALLAAALLGQAFLHVFAAVLTGAAVALVLTLRETGARARCRELLRVGVSGLPAASVLVAAVVAAHRDVADPNRATRVSSLARRLVELPRLVAPGPPGRAAVAAVVVGVAVGSIVWRATRRGLTRDERTLALYAALMGAFAVFAPDDVPGWQLFGQRFVPIGAVLTVALLPVDALAKPRARRAAALVLASLTALSLWVTRSFHHQLAVGCSDLIAGTDADVSRRGVSFHAQLASASCGLSERASEVPRLDTLTHAGELYAAIHGGATSAMQLGAPSMHLIGGRAMSARLLRGDAPGVGEAHRGRRVEDVRAHEAAWRALRRPDDLALRRRVLVSSAAYGMYYESLLVTGAIASDLGVLRELGYAIDWHRGSVLLARFTPCSIEVAVSGDGRGDELVFDLGLEGLARPVVLGARAVQAAEPGATSRRTLPWTPCGPVWVVPRFADDRAGSPGRRRCANADAQGRLRVRAAVADARVECVRAPDS